MMCSIHWRTNVSLLPLVLLMACMERTSSFLAGGGVALKQHQMNTMGNPRTQNQQPEPVALFMSKNKMKSVDVLQEEVKDISNVVKDATVDVVVKNGIHNHAVDNKEDDVNGVADDTPTIEVDAEMERDSKYMRMAIELAESCGGVKGERSPFPNAMSGAVLVSSDDRVLGTGCTTYDQNAAVAAIEDAGIVATPLREWCVHWPSDKNLRDAIANSTLYLTLEPCKERKGSTLPPITQLIETSGIPRVVIGYEDPIEDRGFKGAAALHAAGLSVTMGSEREACAEIVSEYTSIVNTKFLRNARRHSTKTKRPLGFLHCSVIDSKDAAAYTRSGNAFSKDFGGQLLSMRDFGSYAIAPPPDQIWATGEEEEEEEDDSMYYVEEDDEDDESSLYFDDEDEQESFVGNPMMPWYRQVDAVIATFPKQGNGPDHDDSLTSRLNGLKWLATQGTSLPLAVERILVMDANDLSSLPMKNDDVNVPDGVDIESLWEGKGRKPVRILLRHSANAMAAAAAQAAATAAKAASDAAQAALLAIDAGDAELAADVSMEYQKAALTSAETLQQEVQQMHSLKQRLIDMGAVVESLKGGEPIDVMNHLGQRNGYNAVVWRSGCWGERGVQAIQAGAFQWVSAHLAVDAVGGKFWQLMLAERCVQAACGPEQKVKIFADQEDISLEYCDYEDANTDCVLTVDGRAVRHVRLDCRVALVDDSRPRELVGIKTVPMKTEFKKNRIEEAPWFL